MSNSNKDNTFIVILWIITITISILSGVITWNWIEPESFLGAIGFIIAWGVCSKIGHFIAMAIVALVSSK
ncbi:MAG TPA: hypothetical protein PLH91_06515 [Tenuifilaceae bacterium]|nr:hypothetical protein [Tenuifilaceae bacterium]HPI44864.1 hypothetical protein [Tenuifilaceae bacterium]HPN22920.1 hypothetical protein [Tenuifilaceae bacterium]